MDFFMTNFRKNLSAPVLLQSILHEMSQISDDARNPNQTEFTLTDTLMAGIALFSLKCPSLLDFDRKRKNPAVIHNLKILFGVQKTPSDTQMREILDEVDPSLLRAEFNGLLAHAPKRKEKSL